MFLVAFTPTYCPFNTILSFHKNCTFISLFQGWGQKTVMWYFMEVILQAGDLYLYGSSLFLFSQVLRNIVFMDPGIGELLHHFLLLFFQILCLFSINKGRGFLLGLPVLGNYSEHWFGLFSILEMKFTISSCPFYLLRTFHLDFLIPKQWNNKFYF